MNQTLQLVTSHGYAIVFIIVFLDQAAISLPAPPFVAAMGVLSAAGRFNPVIAFAVVLIAACLSDLLWYLLGRSKRMRLSSDLIPHRLKVRALRIATFLGRGILGGLLTVKFSLVPSSLMPFFAGSTQFPLGRFFLFGAVANLIWASVFFLGGFLGTAAVKHWSASLAGLL